MTKPDSDLFDLYDQLDRIEELIEDMLELGINSRVEAEAKLADLNRQIDSLEADEK
ncbi:MAG TPA: hypothetical protein PK691_08785 [Thermomicrobiales bacterium]|nr:hypothetical protein [Thermomicrobiales bacterium]